MSLRARYFRERVCFCVLGAAVLLTLLFLAAEIRLLRLPYQRDYAEGYVMCLANTILDSSQAYKTLDTPPYIANSYTPLYLVAARVTEGVSGNLLMAGRWLALLSTLGTALVVGWTIVFASSARAPLLWRVAGGALGGTAALLTDSVSGWSSLMRVDMLGVLLMYAGLGVYIVLGKRERWQYVAAVLFVLAIFTKQTLLSAPLACLAFGLLTEFRRTLRVAAFTIALIAVAVWWLNAVTFGGFLTSVIDYNVNPFHWTRAAILTFVHLRDSIPRTALAAAALAGIFQGAVIRKQGWRRWWNVRSRNPYTRAMLLAGLNCAFAGASMAAFGKIGANYNHAIAWDISTCMLCGFLLFRLLATWRMRSTGLAMTALTAVLFAALLMPASELLVTLSEAPPPDANRAEADVLSMVRDTPGPVFSENLLLLLDAHKPVDVEQTMVTFLAETGAWDETPYVQMFEQRHFSLLVTLSLANPERYSPRVMAAIERNYVPFEVIGPYKIYRPR